ncbi:PAS domain-containing sensor histidine kinase [Hymenobacter sp. J193]|uniref:PAS domain-containing sensor histidine kinase n=1 Tax=Hymenobacter sp. J193 TaxID=2898429 RepID=UPI002151CE44|nr:PAS domain-containing sensor histidine kinase [Hymenobacter sp. J193]MCR5890201.1 PAS domain-containing sensor histidine kinase [Hymenobacter sp. J193]
MPAFPASLPPPDDLTLTLLNVSLTGVILFRPVLAGAGSHDIVDLAYEFLNPSARRMLQLPEQPAETFLTLYPNATVTGIFDFYRNTYNSGEAGRYDVNYQHDGLDNFFHLSAQRSGELLVVSFTDTADQNRTAAEEALRESQAREQAARATAERERNLLNALLTQAPVAMGVLQGDEQKIVAVNEQMSAIWGYSAIELLGRPLLEAVPELQGQGFTELMEEVARTGVPFVGTEVAARLRQEGRLDTHYFNFVYQPLYDADGALLGVLDIAVDVTAQVLSRHEAQNLNEELAATNEELHAANEEFLQNNADLFLAQQELRLLNQELEARVQDRTAEARQARATAEGNRARLERLFMQAPAAICILDGPELVYELVNPGYQQLFPGRQLQGKPILEALPEIAGHEVHRTFRLVYETGITHTEPGLLIPFARPEDGQLENRYFNYIQQPRFNEHGHIDGVLVFAFEVTQQVEARQHADKLQKEVVAAMQRQVQERETFYQVFAQTPAAICIQRGPEHRYEYVNEAYQQFFPGRQLLGRTVAEALPETVDSGVVDLLDAVYQTGETYSGTELPLLIAQPDGQPPRQMYFTFTYQAYRENGEIVGISTFAYDVAAQVLARQQREAQQQQLQVLFEQAPVAIAVFRGADYVIEVANPSVASLWRRTPSEVIGRPLLEALPEVREQGFKELLDEIAVSGEAFVAQEVSAMLARGPEPETIYLNFVYQPLRDTQGTITSIAVVATEVTEQVAARRSAEQSKLQAQTLADELAALNQQLTRTNIDLDNFIYTASHDLKAPITNIEGLLHVLQSMLTTSTAAPEVGPVLGMMYESVARFKRTINHLADVTKLQKEHTQPTTEVALAPVLRDVQLDLAPLLSETGGRLTIDVDACPSVRFSVKNLRSVLFNLLSNALKYRRPDRLPEIRVACHPDGDYTVLTVQDNGLGLAPEQLPELFTMFRRLHSHVEGTGLGLYMVKRSVENAGGRVSVTSEPGVGSVFSVYFRRS